MRLVSSARAIAHTTSSENEKYVTVTQNCDAPWGDGLQLGQIRLNGMAVGAVTYCRISYLHICMCLHHCYASC